MRSRYLNSNNVQRVLWKWTAIPNALINVLEEGLVCAVDEALRTFLASTEDPEGLRQSLASKSQEAGARKKPTCRSGLASLTPSGPQPPTLAATPSRDAIQDIGMRLV